jgi:protein TonB
MDRHYILPIAIAAAVHGGLLFGYRPAHAIVAPVVKDVVQIIPFAIPPEPEVPVVTETENSQPAKGAPAAPTSLLDLSNPAPDAIVINVPKVPVNTTAAEYQIPVEPHGIPSGAIGGMGDIVSSLFLDSTPHTRVQGAPVYPFEAKRGGLSGRVDVEFVVDEAGRVHDPHVIRSTDRSFEEPTLRAVSKWRFEPGRKNGKVVSFRMSVPVEFNLND